MASELRTIGSFEVVEVLGRGGMGVVYRARQPSMGREVALKEILLGAHGNPDFAARFLQEAQIGGALSHPNIVVVYDYFQEAGGAYIAMELVHRGPLTRIIGTLTAPQRYGVLEAVLAALAAAGEAGIAHRDLKPANLLVTSDGRLKVADFGIAKAYDATAHLTLTGTGVAVGTPAYMAPEQVTAGQVDARTDLYAVGVLAYELFTGRPPFDPTLPLHSLLYKHVHEIPPSPRAIEPGLPAALDRWIERILAKQPDHRPPSASDAWAELEEICVEIHGWRWRREARLSEHAPRAKPAPLAPAPFPDAESDDATADRREAPAGDPEAGPSTEWHTFVEPPPPRAMSTAELEADLRDGNPPRIAMDPAPPSEAGDEVALTPPPPAHEARDHDPLPTPAAPSASDGVPTRPPRSRPPSVPEAPARAVAPRAKRRVRGSIAALALVIAVSGVIVATLTRSGGGDDDKAPASGSPARAGIADTATLGTTDDVVALDPAGAYDLGSQQLIGNLYQTLLAMPAGGDRPEPDAAESCTFSDPRTYSCTLKPDLTFSSGDPLTSADVKFSLERMLEIEDPTGPYTLLASLDSVEAPDPQTVTMHLKRSDATWPYILTHSVAAIVPDELYPRDEKQPDDKVIGSGPYTLEKYTPDQQAVFKKNPNYSGANEGQTENFIVQYFGQPAALKLAIENGDVDIAYRSLSPADIEALRNSGTGVQVVEGTGTEIRYIVFNVTKEPVDELAVRQAIAQVIDREAIAESIYKGTATPLYSMVPAALPGAKESFKDKYGTPDPTKAKTLLEEAGVATPVELDGWYTPTHYGPVEADMWGEIKRQLEASGLFKVNVDSTEWEEYKDEAFAKGTYSFYGLGWFPDFPDADNYLSPFMRDGGFYVNGYSSKEVNDLLDEETTTDDAGAREEAIGKLQDIQAEDVPLIPLWEGKQVAVVRDGVEGVEKTFDPAYQFRFSVVTKKADN